MSETLLLGYAQTVGILLLGIFTVVWNNRRKKEVSEVKDTVAKVKDTVDIVHVKINSMRDKELEQTKDLGEAIGAEAGRQQRRAEDREDKIDNISLAPSAAPEPPVKVIVDQPADVNIVKDDTKNKK